MESVGDERSDPRGSRQGRAGSGATRLDALVRCGALALIVGAASPAAAQAPAGSTSEPNGHVDLSWVRLAGAEDCPPPDLMRASVADLLDHDPFAGSGGEPYLRVEGVASRPRAGWTAVVFFRDGEGAPLGSREGRREGCPYVRLHFIVLGDG